MRGIVARELVSYGITLGGRIPTITLTGPVLGGGCCIGGPPPPPMVIFPPIPPRPPNTVPTRRSGPLMTTCFNLPMFVSASCKEAINGCSYAGPRIETPHSNPPVTIDPAVPLLTGISAWWSTLMSCRAKAVPSPSKLYDSTTVWCEPQKWFSAFAMSRCCTGVRILGLSAVTSCPSTLTVPCASSADCLALPADTSASWADRFASPASLVPMATHWSLLVRSSPFLLLSAPLIDVIRIPIQSSPTMPPVMSKTLAISTINFIVDGRSGGRMMPRRHACMSSRRSCHITQSSIATPIATTPVNHGSNFSKGTDEFSKFFMSFSSRDIAFSRVEESVGRPWSRCAKITITLRVESADSFQHIINLPHDPLCPLNTRADQPVCARAAFRPAEQIIRSRM